jgi:hypothetical protein
MRAANSAYPASSDAGHNDTLPVFLLGDEARGGCETCADAIAAEQERPITRLYLPVRRDDTPAARPVRLCADCSSIIRHGAHEEWDGLVTLGKLNGRVVTWYRGSDDSVHSGMVIREAVEENFVVVAPAQSLGVFRNVYQTVHRSHITLVWPLVSQAVAL